MSNTEKQFPLNMSNALFERILNYQFDNRIRTTSEAVRELIEYALEKKGKKKGS